MIRIKIVPKDTSIVAKVVLIDQNKRVLLLKRSDYVQKFSGDWDLPGGHLKPDETLEDGLTRETHEETGLYIKNPTFLSNIDNLHFFYAMYDSQEIVLSHEHTDYKFFKKDELDPNHKFQKVALQALNKKRSVENA